MGCADLTGPAPQVDLDAAHARWQATHMSDYQFDFQRSCFCGPDITRQVTITVWGRAPLSIVYSDSGTAADSTLFRQYLTMERYFTFLQNEVAGHPATFTAVFDSSTGYPRQVFIDDVATIADDEVTLHIFALRPLP